MKAGHTMKRTLVIFALLFVAFTAVADEWDLPDSNGARIVGVWTTYSGADIIDVTYRVMCPDGSLHSLHEGELAAFRCALPPIPPDPPKPDPREPRDGNGNRPAPRRRAVR
jgi:hypothetical protein